MPFLSPGFEIIVFSCSIQMGVKFILLINVKMQTIVGILTFISRINTSSESFTESKFILEHSSFFKKNLEVIIHADLS